MNLGTRAPGHNSRPPGESSKSALDESGGGGLLLGASGNQILLDGVPLGAAAGEKSFAQLLTSSGIASIHFGTTTSQAQFARFVRGFPSGNAKPTALAEQLKATLAGDTSIKINEIRYVAEDSSVAGIKMAANLTAKVLGAERRQVQRSLRRSEQAAPDDSGCGKQPRSRRWWFRARGWRWRRRWRQRFGHALGYGCRR